jgi:2-polyprenyl-3-methyl-5-hydroxy-6-metoxy-1,4-benzoquinol methylase
MSSAHEGIPIDHHDWHSQGYVAEWIARDLTRDDERRKRLQQMLAAAPASPEDEIMVLDVGGGYGVVTEEVLHAFARAHVTLQDYSLPMLEEARRRLSAYAGRVGFAQGDLRAPDWVRQVGGPFDLVVSAIAIHNLRDRAEIAACYRAIAGLVKPEGAFLDYDLFELIGGIEAQLKTIRDAGFAKADCLWQEGRVAIIAAKEPQPRA